MTDASKPAPMRDANGRWLAGGPSPFPKGRPKGIIDKRQKLQKVFAENSEELVRLVVSRALDGDMQAMREALARVSPPIKATGERVEFDLDPELPLSVQANQILLAVSEGKLDADTGRTLIAMIQSVAGIQAVEALHERVIALEAREV